MLKRLEELKQRLGHVGWHALCLFFLLRIGDLANISYRVLLGRYQLGGLDFGALNPVLAVLAIFGIPATVIFQVGAKSIARLRALGRHDQCVALVRDLAKIAALGSVLSFLSLHVFGDYILARLHLESTRYLHIIGAMVALAWWMPFCQAVVQGRQHYRLASLPSIVTPFFVLGLLIVLVRWVGMGMDGALTARVAGSGGTVLVLILFLRTAFVGNRAAYPEEWKKIRAMLFPMLIYMSCSQALFQFDHLFVRNFLIADSHGYAAVTTLGQIPARLMDPLAFVLYAFSSRRHVEGRDLRRHCVAALAAGTVVTAASVGFFALAARPIMEHWNANFVPYHRMVCVFAVASGSDGILVSLAVVNLARHRYGFLWVVPIPVVALCIGVYGAKVYLRLPVTVETVLYAATAARFAAAAITAIAALRRGKRECRSM